MDLMRPQRLLPTLPMLAESLREAGWQCTLELTDENQRYRGIRLYHRQQELQKDVLYLLRPTETGFPFDDYSYISTKAQVGRANHLICPGRPDEEILDQVLEVFSRFQSWEESIDLLLYRNASLQELCDLGAELLDNPICIHDDWFVMMAMTSEFTELMEPEYWTTSANGFIPRAVVEDFQNDSDYLETYAHHEAQLWRQNNEVMSLYVNLWDGTVYKGRMLVLRKNRDFLHRDFLLAEVLTQRAVMLLRRSKLDAESSRMNMDTIVFSLLQGRTPEQAELNHLLNMLNWQRTDRFLCLRLKPQFSGSSTVAEHLLHSDLFRIFPECYILLNAQEQTVLWNLSRVSVTLSQIRHRLAPVCRDYCMYAGISSPVTGIRELQAAYYQAGAALDQTFRLRSEKWILTFSECAMSHVTKVLPPPLNPSHLIAPELLELKSYDAEHATPYFETLRAYLLCERDIPRTSETLIIHRTTLLYRLKKIRTLVSLDLDDPWRRLYLTFSLWLLEKDQEER